MKPMIASDVIGRLIGWLAFLAMPLGGLATALTGEFKCFAIASVSTLILAACAVMLRDLSG